MKYWSKNLLPLFFILKHFLFPDIFNQSHQTDGLWSRSLAFSFSSSSFLSYSWHKVTWLRFSAKFWNIRTAPSYTRTKFICILFSNCCEAPVSVPRPESDQVGPNLLWYAIYGVGWEIKKAQVGIRNYPHSSWKVCVLTLTIKFYNCSFFFINCQA